MAGKTTSTKSNVVALPSAKKSAVKAAPEKTAVKKPSKIAKVKEKAQKVVQFLQHSKDTTGTYMFKAINEKGVPLDAREAAVSTLYERKEAVTGKPAFIRVTVEHFDSLEAMIAPAASTAEDN